MGNREICSLEMLAVSQSAVLPAIFGIRPKEARTGARGQRLGGRRGVQHIVYINSHTQ